MITTVGPGSSEFAFTFAAFRALETAMGIALWAAMSTFIWPQTNIDELKKLGHEVIDSHRQLMRRYREKALEGKCEDADADGNGESQKQVRDRAGVFLTQLEQTINAAAVESYQVREVRHLWQRFLRMSLQAVGIIDRLESGYSEMQKEGLRKIIENEEALFDELDARLAEALRLLDGEKPGRSSIDITIGIDRDLLAPLDHFERAAVEVTRSELEKLGDLVAAMVDCVRDIEGFQPERAETEGAKWVAAQPGPSVFRRSIPTGSAAPSRSWPQCGPGFLSGSTSIRPATSPGICSRPPLPSPWSRRRLSGWRS
jgi:hypothetical protein